MNIYHQLLNFVLPLNNICIWIPLPISINLDCRCNNVSSNLLGSELPSSLSLVVYCASKPLVVFDTGTT